MKKLLFLSLFIGLLFIDCSKGYFGKDGDSSGLPVPAANEIYYTTSNGKKLDLSQIDWNTEVKSHKSKGNGVYAIVFKKPITTIEYGMFWGYQLKSIRLPNSVTLIEEDAFAYCQSLTTITIPNSVTKIGEKAFSDCHSLTTINIPNSVTEIGEKAIYRCWSLSKIEGKFASADGRCLIMDGKLVAFAPFGLTNYTIPNSVTEIKMNTFEGCDSLTSIIIPNSITKIGDEAFYFCENLTTITIPNSVTEIGKRAFSYCRNVTSIYCKSTTPPIGYANMFYSPDSKLKIYVPRASVSAYKIADGWSKYADAIEPYDFTD